MAQRYDTNGVPIPDTNAPVRGVGQTYDADGNLMVRNAPAPAPERSPGYTEARRLERERDQYRSDPTGLSDFSSQMIHNLGVRDELRGGGAYVTQWLTNMLRGQNRISPTEAAEAAYDHSRSSGERYAQERPLANIGSVAASVVAGGGAPTAAAMAPMTATRAALTSGALDAPFAIARQDGTIPERVERALPEIAISTAAGGVLQGLVSRFLRPGPSVANSTRERVERFNQAGVNPSFAATEGGMQAGMAKAIGENWIAGANVRRNLERSIEQTGDAAERIARGYAEPQPRELVGETVEEGVRRFAQDQTPMPGAPPPEAHPTRDWSFAAKSRALYDDVFEQLAREERSFIDDVAPVPITTDATRAALASIRDRVVAPNIAELINDPLIQRIDNALAQDASALRFGDLRALRTWVREAQNAPELRQSIGEANLQRLEQALTQDIYGSAAAIGQGTNLAQRLRRADQYYAAGMERIQNALRPFDPTRGVSPARAYDHIVSMASDRSQTNTAALLSLKRTLRPEEWRTVVATVIHNMGQPRAGAAGQIVNPTAFSVDNFATAWNHMTDAGRRVLFSSRGGGSTADDALFAELDNLARVADMQKGVEAMTNRSRSGVNVQNIGTVAALGNALTNPGAMVWTASGLGAAMITGEMLTNPGFVRWLANAPLAGRVGWANHMAALAQLAQRDPALHALYQDLSGESLEQEPVTVDAQ